jgi:hypothetical protein
MSSLALSKTLTPSVDGDRAMSDNPMSDNR